MAKQIIILERLDLPSDNSFRAVFWLAVPSTRIAFYANAAATSAWHDASGADITAIQTGNVKEVVETFSYPASTTIATIQAALVARFNYLQNAMTNQNPFNRYGSFYDGSAWTGGSVA